MSVTYQVVEINSDSKILTVARADYLSNICPAPLINNTVLNPALFNYTSDTGIIGLYYGCPTIDQTRGISSPFSCNNSNMILNGTANYYLTRSLGSVGANISASLRSCSLRIDLAAKGTWIQWLDNMQRPSPQNLTAALAAGFGLQWMTDNRLCDMCIGSGGQCGRDIADLNRFSCYCSDQPYDGTCGDGAKGKLLSKRKLELILGITVPAGSILILTVIVLLRLKTKSRSSLKSLYLESIKKSRFDQKIEAFISQHGSLAPKRFSYSEIRKITNSFSEKLGQGGYGSVYKGKLPDGRNVAVKLLSKSKADGQDFINEVATISITSHVNIVSLLGFCYERKRALIYEFLPNGSLDKFIYSRGSAERSNLLEIKTLFEIALGIARGLEYLHRGCNMRILHFDIKPHNILLDEDLAPKISDFGLAKLCETRESVVSMTAARGTCGYIAPEVFCREIGGVSYKSDVYSYGMMVLEMVGGRKNMNEDVDNTSEVYFPSWLYKQLEKAEKLKLNRVIAEEEEEMTRKLIVVSLWCIQTFPSERPSMSRVLEMLQGSVEALPVPPKLSTPSPESSPRNSTTTSSISNFRKDLINT